MKNAILKDTFREIKKSFSRFMSIFAITAIGVGFFAGIKAASPDMKLTADQYYKDQGLMDIRLVSTYGFDQDELKNIRSNKETQLAEGGYSIDALLNFKDLRQVVRVHSFSVADQKINLPLLKEGRLPEKSGECVIENGIISSTDLKIGDKITLRSGKVDEPISDTLKTDTFTITGIVESPQYISYDLGTSSVGNGSVDSFMLIPDEDFKYDYYTEIYVRAKALKDLPFYGNEYILIADKLKDVYETASSAAALNRFDDIQLKAKNELDEAKTKLNDGRIEAANAFAKAQGELSSAKATLLAGRNEYNRNLKLFNDSIAAGEKQLSDGRKALADGEAQYAANLADYNEGIAQLEPAKAQLDAEKEAIDQGYEGLAAAESVYDILLQLSLTLSDSG
ncbi:MAG: hypothetical protein HGA49_11365, partial [Eubacteriaceae bacterium]|nr:hypothetical protein [Eubacteriaceae bacterium]